MALKQLAYSKFAKYYDIIELGQGEGPVTSSFLNKILKKHKVKTLLDMTCGTGAQSIGLAKKGYKVIASDINKEMLKIARKKTKNLKIKFYHGDIRKSKFGKFDAVIAMFNAIGHLTKKDFEKAIMNVSENLKDNGLFIFDIENLDAKRAKDFPKYKSIEAAFCILPNGEVSIITDAVKEKGTKVVVFGESKMNYKKGIVTYILNFFIQEKDRKPTTFTNTWEKQIYSVDQLETILLKNGFKVVEFRDRHRIKFNKKKSPAIYVVARKL